MWPPPTPRPSRPPTPLSLRGANGGFDWTGRETISFTNPGPGPLDRVWVRLWGNGPAAATRRARSGSAACGAPAPAAPQRRLHGGPARPLGAARARGARPGQLRRRDPGPAPLDRFGRGGRGLALLSNALPALAPREAGAWRLEPYFPLGEAWVYPAADWRVRLRAPRGVAVAAPGVRRAGGVRHLANGRDYSFAAGRRLRRMRATVDGVRVSVWGAAQHRARAELRDTVRRARSAPRAPERDVRPLRLAGPPDRAHGGDRDGAHGADHGPEQNFVLAHELSHMWWYALIGSDQARSPWLDEGFASYAEDRLAAQRAGLRRAGLEPRRLLTRGVDYWAEHRSHYITVYFEGACLLQLLERPARARALPRRAARLRARAPLRLAHRRVVHGGDGRRRRRPGRPRRPLVRLRAQYGGSPRAVARDGLVARRRRRGARARCRPRSRSSRRARRPAARRRAARRRGSRPPRASRARAAPRARSARRAPASNSSTPSRRRTWGTRLSANSVSAAQVARRREALQMRGRRRRSGRA